MPKIERALLSVWDKTGVVEFARALHEMDVELLSTGGTARALREAGLPVRDVSDFTGFPEMLDGRVKTLHPRVHAGLLFRRNDPAHTAAMAEHDLAPIDLVCVNLYPFEATVANPGVSFEEAIEQIDIGGPTLIRAAAKNMRFVTVATDPTDYDRILDAMREHDGNTTEELRLELGRKVFARVAAYNAAIAAWLYEQASEEGSRPFIRVCPEGEPLRYGENPHQSARFYREPPRGIACIGDVEQVHGKAMSYNNYVDGDAALEAVKELAGTPAVAIVKHTNPCGYATGKTLVDAFEAAWAGDTVSAFGSVIAVTVPVDLATAEKTKGRFIEALIAPDFEPEALAFLRAKSKDLRLLRLRAPLSLPEKGVAFRQVNGGILVQDRDVGVKSHWVVPTETPFPEEKRALAEFGMRACKHVKSNAIVIVREYEPGFPALLGMGAGQPNRVDSVRKLAITKARENVEALYENTGGYGRTPSEFSASVFEESVLVSDAFFPFPDNIQNAAEAGIRYVVQPGGSVRDEEVISACDRFGVAMAVTGMRHFRH